MKNFPVRLSAYELNCIRTAFQGVFLNEDELWIFGSRAHLDARGGDIDIFIKAIWLPTNTQKTL